MTDAQRWAKELAPSLIQELRRKYGAGWQHMSHDQRRNAIADRLLSVVFAQRREANMGEVLDNLIALHTSLLAQNPEEA